MSDDSETQMSNIKQPSGPPVSDPLPDGTPLGNLQDAVQAAWMAGSHTTVTALLRQYDLFDWMCPCCASLRTKRFTSANAAHRDLLLTRLCAPCTVVRRSSSGRR